ncbi:MAG: hypothetical protein RB296_05825 [Acidobacteriota bacterium]|nr:hypothetical protein [Acidobacteriota bacterium]
MKETPGEDVIVQFSGGIDSLYTALFLGEKYRRVHLLTFDKGYLHCGLNFSRPNVKRLQEILGPERVIFQIVDIRPLFRELALSQLRRNARDYGNEIAWCIPCRASMALSCMLYALENGIPAFTDGANWEQAPGRETILVTADNYPGYLELIRDFAADFKVDYFSPVYALNSRQERRRLLLEKGFFIDWNSLDVNRPKSVFNLFKPRYYRRYQPVCLSGWLAHWKRNIFHVREDTTQERVLDFIAPRLERIRREFFPAYFQKRGLALEEILARRPHVKSEKSGK